MELWGLTGLAGSGKSLALNFFKKHGVAVIDSDQLARDVVDPQKAESAPVLKRLREVFGAEIFDATTGELLRRKLRAQIVQHPEDQRKLESILHPEILKRIEAWAQNSSVSGALLGVVEGTRLIESGFAGRLRGLILVSSPVEDRLERLQKRDRISEAEARSLLAAQNEGSMREASQVEWVNKGSQEDLEAQVLEFLKSRNLKGRLP